MKSKMIALVAAAVAAVAPAFVWTAPAQADAPVVRPGASILTGTGLSGIEDMTGTTCTVTAVGRDDQNRLLGLTAGHCVPQGTNKEVRLTVGNVRVGEFITEPTGFPGIYTQTPPNLSRDGAFFLLDEGVVGSNVLPDGGKIWGLESTPWAWEHVCRFGQFSRAACGWTIASSGNVVTFSMIIPVIPGDSGGPVHQGGRLAGITSSYNKFSGIDGILADAALDGVTGWAPLP